MWTKYKFGEHLENLKFHRTMESLKLICSRVLKSFMSTRFMGSAKKPVSRAEAGNSFREQKQKPRFSSKSAETLESAEH